MNTRLLEMLELQNSLNASVNPAWLNCEDQDWLLAAMMEGCEMIDHYGWKWWKKQDRNMDQVRMELVDIWHFIMSQEMRYSYIMSGNERDSIAMSLIQFDSEISVGFETIQPFITNAKQLVGQCATGKNPRSAFNQLLVNVGLNFDDLYVWYIGKNVLKGFRQANGYKEGTYVKTWHGREDNEHLVDFLHSVGNDPDNLVSRIQCYLATVYGGVE